MLIDPVQAHKLSALTHTQTEINIARAPHTRGTSLCIPSLYSGRKIDTII